MALVCAAKGCPPLRNEPYSGAKVFAQLEDQTRRFLSDPSKFRIDRASRTVYLSPIFKWYGSDFTKVYGRGGPKDFDEPEKAVLDFIAKHLERTDSDYLQSGDYAISYLDYDWSLNER